MLRIFRINPNPIPNKICVVLAITYSAWYPIAVFLNISLSLYFSSQSLHQRALTNGPEKEKEGVIQNFKRTLSKKEKKKEKKREKEAFSRIPDGDDHTLNREDGWELGFALYDRQAH